MAHAGLVKLARRRETRLVGAQLTSKGETTARVFCGMSGWPASLASEDELRRLAGSQFAAREGRWISERGLAGIDYGGDTSEFVLVESLLLPSLVSGRAESLADSAGRVWYRLADAGPPPDESAPDVEPCDDLRTFYDAEIRRYLHEFTTTKPRNTFEIGPIPMPACVQTRGANNDVEHDHSLPD